MKRLAFSMLLVLCIILSVSLCAYAQVADSGECGDSLTWEYDNQAKTITVKGEGRMTDWSGKTETPWYKYTINNVVVENGVENIGSYAFTSKSVSSLVLPESVTEIGMYSFYGTKFESLVIPDTVTKIGEEAFSCCEKLLELTVPDSEFVLYWEGFFNDCTSIEKLVFSDKATKITGFGHMDSVKSVVIGKNVSEIDYNAFPDSLIDISVSTDNQYFSCDEYGVLFNKDKTKLVCYPSSNQSTLYDIPKGVKIIGECAFAGSWYLKNVSIPEGVTEIENHAFYNCNLLEEAILPEGLEYLGGWSFYDCASLNNVKLPESLGGIHVEAFYNCTSLESIVIPKNVTSIAEGAFMNCEKLSDITICGYVEFCDYMAFYGTACRNNPDNWDRGVFYIGDYLFDTDSSVVSGDYTIKDGTRIISDVAFSGCTNLESVVIPESVEKVRGFNHCTNLKNVYLNGIVPLDDMSFWGCDEINLHIDDFNAWCRGEYLGRDATDMGEIIGCPYNLYNGKIIKELWLPYGITELPAYVFSGCASIERVIFNKELKSIAEAAFLNCKNLEYVKVNDGFVYFDVASFGGCSKLKGVEFPNSDEYWELIIFTETKPVIYGYEDTNLPECAEQCGLTFAPVPHRMETDIVNGEYCVSMIYGGEISGKLCVALYDGDGKLIEVQLLDAAESVPVEFENVVTDGMTERYMWLSETDMMTPLCENMILEI